MLADFSAISPITHDAGSPSVGSTRSGGSLTHRGTRRRHRGYPSGASPDTSSESDNAGGGGGRSGHAAEGSSVDAITAVLSTFSPTVELEDGHVRDDPVLDLVHLVQTLQSELTRVRAQVPLFSPSFILRAVLMW